MSPAPQRPRRLTKSEKARARRDELDAQYRRALGLDQSPGRPGEPAPRLPSAIGQQSSAGGSRGGRGARQKGKGMRS